MTERDEFLAAIENDLDNWDRYAVFSDWLEEHGERDLAVAFRFCWANEERPFWEHTRWDPKEKVWYLIGAATNENPHPNNPVINALHSFGLLPLWIDRGGMSMERQMIRLADGIDKAIDAKFQIKLTKDDTITQPTTQEVLYAKHPLETNLRSEDAPP